MSETWPTNRSKRPPLVARVLQHDADIAETEALERYIARRGSVGGERVA